jgi:hypothetical protein
MDWLPSIALFALWALSAPLLYRFARAPASAGRAFRIEYLMLAHLLLLVATIVTTLHTALG